jgi:hypothetical protein
VVVSPELRSVLDCDRLYVIPSSECLVPDSFVDLGSYTFTPLPFAEITLIQWENFSVGMTAWAQYLSSEVLTVVLWEAHDVPDQDGGGNFLHSTPRVAPSRSL